MTHKIYPDSGVDLKPIVSRNYDKVMNFGSLGLYKGFIHSAIECKYAFDFINRDWKTLLGDAGFFFFTEHHHMKKYVRLLKAVKIR
ncbi:MAG: hypothetical protein U9R60_04915 [Bacteroidota bacterium]|nr:hypothetical protein [Bacteroidota bacterium]